MPFFGVPIRNGLPIGLGSVAGFGVQQFDPSLLFEGGTVPGAWYDPSDLSTMFTTDAGTTPVAMPGGGTAVSVGRILDKSGGGNHAIAINNTTARPELRARVNLLTYSEEFDNAGWVKQASSVTANVAVAPDGTATADKLIENATTNVHYVSAAGQALNGTYVLSVYAKAAERSFVYLDMDDSAGGGTFSGAGYFDLVNGTASARFGATVAISAVGSGWYRCSITATGNATATPWIAVADQAYAGFPNYAGNGTSGIFIWGADLRPANIGANIPAYQRIADANTYDTAGFPLYLRFDGIDDGMYTPANLNLSATDKVGVFAGVRKLADTQGSIAELSATAATNNGSFNLFASVGGAARWFSALRGTALALYEPQTYTAPITSVLSTSFDIAGASISNEIVPRVNGIVEQDNPFGANAGTGNFGTYPLYIGSRNNTSDWLNGHIYSLAVVGSAVSAGNIAAMESWVAGRTGIQI